MSDGLVNLTLYGPVTVTGADGGPIHLQPAQLAVLTALAASPTPVDRAALADAAAVSRGNLSAVLSKIRGALGFVPHRVVGSRSGVIVADCSRITSDVATLEVELTDAAPEGGALEHWLAATSRTPHQGVTLSPGPLTDRIAERLSAGRQEVLRRAAWFDLGHPDALPLRAGLAPELTDPPECWLAHIDHLARTVGADAAQQALAAVDGSLPGIAIHGVHHPFSALASLLIDACKTSQLGPADSQLDLAAWIADQLPAGRPSSAALIRCASVDPRLPEEVAAALERRSTQAVAVWQDAGEPALAVIASLLRRPLADLVRVADLRLPTPSVLAAMRQAVRGDALDNDVEYHQVMEAAASILGANAPSRLAVVVGRDRPRSDDCDRALADLAAGVPGLSLVVLHRDPLDAGTSPLSPLAPVDLEAPGNGDSDLASIDLPPSPDAAVPHDRTPSGSPIGVDLSAIADLCSVDGVVNADAVEYARRRIGVALPGPPEASSSSADDLGPDAPSPGWRLQAEDRRWLSGELVRWLLSRPVSMVEVSLLLDRATELTEPALKAEVSATIRRVARHRSSLGNYSEAVELVSRAMALDPGPDEQRALLHQRGDLLRELGRWQDALVDYRLAMSIEFSAPDDLRHRAELALRMARLTWDPKVGAEVDAHLADALACLSVDEQGLRARLCLCLAGGSFQDGEAGTRRFSRREIEEAVRCSERLLDPVARAWALIHARKALLSVVSVDESMRLARRIVAAAGNDRATQAHGHQALYVDHVRQGSWSQADVERRRLLQLARSPVSAEQTFSSVVADVCWSFASGDLEHAEQGIGREKDFGDLLSGATFKQIILAHEVWLARERGDQAVLGQLAEAALGMARSQPEGGIWTAGAALLANDTGAVDVATTVLKATAIKAGGFDRLPEGPHRLPVLAIAAQVAWADVDGRLDRRDRQAILAGLKTADAAVVLIGWPTVVLGSIERFRAYALASLGHDDEASIAADRAVEADRPMAALLDRSLQTQAELQRGRGRRGPG